MTTTKFDGKTYDPALDDKRLKKQLGRVFDVMKDGKWRTLSQVAEGARGTEASVSARLRDLRKPRFGGYTVERERALEMGAGIWVYKLIARTPDSVRAAPQV